MNQALPLTSPIFARLKLADLFLLALALIWYAPRNSRRPLAPLLSKAPYIITDFIHLRAINSGPIWLDILLLSSCAGTGLAMAYISLSQIHDEFCANKKRLLGWLLAFTVLVLSGFGIYLGRFLRWRSIDLALNPLGLVNDVFERLLSPLTHYRAWGVSFGFATFLLLGYLIFRNMRVSARSNP